MLSLLCRDSDWLIIQSRDSASSVTKLDSSFDHSFYKTTSGDPGRETWHVTWRNLGDVKCNFHSFHAVEARSLDRGLRIVKNEMKNHVTLLNTNNRLNAVEHGSKYWARIVRIDESRYDLRASHFTYQYCDWSIQTMRAKSKLSLSNFLYEPVKLLIWLFSAVTCSNDRHYNDYTLEPHFLTHRQSSQEPFESPLKSEVPPSSPTKPHKHCPTCGKKYKSNVSTINQLLIDHWNMTPRKLNNAISLAPFSLLGAIFLNALLHVRFRLDCIDFAHTMYGLLSPNCTKLYFMLPNTSTMHRSSYCL